MDEISRQYNQLLDEGASITELYVYHLIVNDERSFGMSEKEIIEMVRDAIDKRYSSTQGIEYIYCRFTSIRRRYCFTIKLIQRPSPNYGIFRKGTRKKGFK